VKTVNLTKSEIRVKRKNNEPILTFNNGDSITVTINMSSLSGYIEVGDSHFRFNSSVYLPNEFAADAEELGSSGIVIVEQIYRILEYSESKILITGHTDTVGSVENNAKLSEYRASSIYALIMGDRELFKTVSDAPHISNKDTKGTTLMKDKLQIADWAANEFGWSCRHKNNNFDFLKTFKAFQRSYNKWYCTKFNTPTIAEDGDWGPDTWGAVFDCYEWVLAKRLMIPKETLPAYRQSIDLANRFKFPQKHIVGCSEYHPLENAAADNYQSKTNRRVEILFFDEESTAPDLACANKGACNGKGCPLFDLFVNVRGRTIMAEWQDEQCFAGSLDKREMYVISPIIKPGDIVTFTVYLLLDDGEIKQVGSVYNASIEPGKATALFEELSEETRKAIPCDWCRPYSYFYVGRGPDFMVASFRLPHRCDSPYFTDDIN
jgi:outer membrane protein OmpA-like peptidoglycan-associated protein